jgi:hypothetical protein
MLNDLEECIQELQRENHEIILMADWNEDIRGRRLINYMNKLELKEAILSRLGTRHAPSTYIKGSVPIDSIFTTTGISIEGSGYFTFSEGVKGKPDHRAAWIDVTMTSTLGYKIPTTVRPSMQRVTTKDMQLVQASNKALSAFVQSHQLGERITKLESTVHYPPTAAERQEAEALMQLRMAGIKAADLVCKKLRTGDIPYSHEFARLTAQQNFWSFLGDLKEGKKKHQRRLESYRKLAGIVTPLADLKWLDLNTIRTNAKDAYHRYKTFTGRQAEKARHNWMEGLINEQQHKENEERYKQNPDEGSSSKVKKKHKRQPRATADILRQMVFCERERVMYRRMSAALKPQRLSTSMVIAPNGNEEWTERTTKQDMEKAIMEHHVRKYIHTHTTPPMRMPIQ